MLLSASDYIPRGGSGIDTIAVAIGAVIAIAAPVGWRVLSKRRGHKNDTG
jgi:hypothetical protein